MKDFITPPDHIHFLAKKLFGPVGNIIDGSIAYLEPDGGGPVKAHVHEHNHLFMVTQGEIKIQMNDKTIILKENESYLVQGKIPHSVWNNSTSTSIVVGISVM